MFVGPLTPRKTREVELRDCSIQGHKRQKIGRKDVTDMRWRGFVWELSTGTRLKIRSDVSSCCFQLFSDFTMGNKIYLFT